MAEIDLGALAAAYRFRPISQRALERAEMAARTALDPLLDVGGGNGGHAKVWAGLGRTAIVLDLSDEMVKRTAARGHVLATQADAHAMPFKDHVFGLAYFHMSIHYGDWERILDEAIRVVRPGGSIEIWTFDPSGIKDSSLGRWFPRVIEIDTQRFPSTQAIATHLAQGSNRVEITSEVEPIERSAGDWVRGVRGRFVSTLQLLDEKELEFGVSAFREQYPNDDDLYRYEARYTTVRCVV